MRLQNACISDWKHDLAAVGWDAIHGTANIGRVLGMTRSAVQLAMQRGRLTTYVVAGRACASAEEIHRFYRAESGLDRWESEGGSIR